MRSFAIHIVILACAGMTACHRPFPEPPPAAQPALAAELAQLQAGGLPSYLPPDGVVPDSVTAARIAEAVWIPIYGEENPAAAPVSRVARG